MVVVSHSPTAVNITKIHKMLPTVLLVNKTDAPTIKTDIMENPYATTKGASRYFLIGVEVSGGRGVGC